MENDSLLNENVRVIGPKSPRAMLFVLAVWLTLFGISSKVCYDMTIRVPVRTPMSVQIHRKTLLLNSNGDLELRYGTNLSAHTVYLSNGMQFSSDVIGSLHGTTYYNAVLAGLDHNTTYFYGFSTGGLVYHFKTPQLTNNRLALVGDTKPPVGHIIFGNMVGVDVIVHLGDMSYAGNDGGCYGGLADPRCAYNCTQSCQFDTRNVPERDRLWDDFFRESGRVLSSIPLVTQAGNHDGDLFWQYMFIPTFSTRHLGSFFMSVDVGADLRILSMNTEDNINNPYDRWNSIDDPFDWYRFNNNFGINSTQYMWAMEEVRRPKTRSVLLYTHRPPVHSSRHHPNCAVGGDWYRCELRKLYAPLLNHVDFVFSGHSHHYMRVDNVMLNNETVTQGGNGTSYFIVGTGGYPLSRGFRQSDDLDGTFCDDKYGFVVMSDGNFFEFRDIHNYKPLR